MPVHPSDIEHFPSPRDLIDMATLYLELGLPHRAQLALDCALMREGPQTTTPLEDHLTAMAELLGKPRPAGSPRLYEKDGNLLYRNSKGEEVKVTEKGKEDNA